MEIMQDPNWDGSTDEFSDCVQLDDRPDLGKVGNRWRVFICDWADQEPSLCSPLFEKWWLGTGPSELTLSETEWATFKQYAYQRDQDGHSTVVQTDVSHNGMDHLTMKTVNFYITAMQNVVGTCTVWFDANGSPVAMNDVYDFNELNRPWPINDFIAKLNQTKPPTAQDFTWSYH